MAPIPKSIEDALDRLWIKFLPETELRVAQLEAAAQALTHGPLPDEQRETAHGAAHKLAGTLGTFGLPRGTELARQAEDLFDGQAPMTSAKELAGWVAELRTVIETRK